jgi:hypothetical protein
MHARRQDARINLHSHALAARRIQAPLLRTASAERQEASKEVMQANSTQASWLAMRVKRKEEPEQHHACIRPKDFSPRSRAMHTRQSKRLSEDYYFNK